MPALFQFAALLTLTIFLHEIAHFGTAKLFGFNPQRFFNIKNWKRSNSIYSMTFNAPIGTSFWKILMVLLAGPMIEISFITIGIFYDNFLLIFVSVGSLIGSCYDFGRIYNLYKYRNDYKTFGYFGT